MLLKNFLFLELSDALVAIEYGTNRSEEFRNIVDYNIKCLAKDAHGYSVNYYGVLSN